MSSIVTDQQSHPLFLDCLYCEEKYWEDNNYEIEDDDNDNDNDAHSIFNVEAKHDDYGDEQLIGLFCKEEKEHFNEGDLSDNNKWLIMERKEGLDWMIRVNCHYNFSALTLVLSVNYFDKMIICWGENDRPWMTQLAAVACLSLASKLEHSHSPLLSHLLVENKYAFDTKTVQRMELLVLSTFEWKMYAITPLSFLDYLITRLKIKDPLHWQILHRCQSLILSAIADPRYLCYAPSVLAVATMLIVLKEFGLWSTLENQMCLMNTFKLDKEKIEKCQKFINEFSSKDNKKAEKRKRSNSTESPKNVLDAVFCERSKDSNLIYTSPEPEMKRSRTINSFSSLN